MDYILGPEVRSQDTKLLVASLLQNPETRQLSWPLVRDRWAEVQKKSGDLVFGGNGVVIAALGTFCDNRTRQDVAKFFAAHKVPDAARTLQQTLERIDECSALRATQPATLTTWLAAHKRGAADRSSSGEMHP